MTFEFDSNTKIQIFLHKYSFKRIYFHTRPWIARIFKKSFEIFLWWQISEIHLNCEENTICWSQSPLNILPKYLFLAVLTSIAFILSRLFQNVWLIKLAQFCLAFPWPVLFCTISPSFMLHNSIILVCFIIGENATVTRV